MHSTPTAPSITPTTNTRGPSSRLVVHRRNSRGNCAPWKGRSQEGPYSSRQVLQCLSLASGAWAPRWKGRRPLFTAENEGNFNVIKYENGNHPANQIPEGSLRRARTQGLQSGGPGREGLLTPVQRPLSATSILGRLRVRLSTPRLPPAFPGRMRSAHSSLGHWLCPLPLLGLGRLRGAPAQCASLQPRTVVLLGESRSPSSSAFAELSPGSPIK